MTRTTLIKRLGLASGITIIAASGVLITTAAGNPTHSPHHPRVATCQTSRQHANFCQHRRRGFSIHHQRTIHQPRQAAPIAGFGRMNHRQWGGCCDWRNPATTGNHARQHRGHYNGYRHPGSRYASHRHGYRHTGYRSGGYHRHSHQHWGYRHDSYRHSGGHCW